MLMLLSGVFFFVFFYEIQAREQAGVRRVYCTTDHLKTINQLIKKNLMNLTHLFASDTLNLMNSTHLFASDILNLMNSTHLFASDTLNLMNSTHLFASETLTMKKNLTLQNMSEHSGVNETYVTVLEDISYWSCCCWMVDCFTSQQHASVSGELVSY